MEEDNESEAEQFDLSKIDDKNKLASKKDLGSLGKETNWYVYLLECLDGSYYTGITSDIKHRMRKHKSGKGSKYVRAKGFGNLIASKSYPNRSEALKAEYRLKQLPKVEKLNFFIE